MQTIIIKTTFIGKDGYYTKEEESCSADWAEFKRKRITLVDRWCFNVFKENSDEDIIFKMNRINDVEGITFQIVMNPC